MRANLKRGILLTATALMGVVTLSAHRAQAALGENESAVENDRAALEASTVKKTVVHAHAAVPATSVSKESATAPSYSVHEMDAQGTTVKEYVSDAGVVFAVTWRGMVPPDLSVLFGSYYNEYLAEDSRRVKTGGQRMYDVKTSALLVHRGGHMRDLRGKAIISDLVPAGVGLEAIQ